MVRKVLVSTWILMELRWPEYILVHCLTYSFTETTLSKGKGSGLRTGFGCFKIYYIFVLLVVVRVVFFLSCEISVSMYDWLHARWICAIIGSIIVRRPLRANRFVEGQFCSLVVTFIGGLWWGRTCLKALVSKEIYFQSLKLRLLFSCL